MSRAGERSAVVLVSGGLDSVLAVKLLLEQGIAVLGIRFVTPFADHGLLERRGEEERHWEERYGIPLSVEDISEEYLRLLDDPPHGFGKRYNPCIDCKILFLTRAKRIMEETGASFVATGEVPGQRPMSQRLQMLRHIEKESGLSGRLLRPLSALKLPETEPERLGWVDRSRLEGITGRGRERQFALARRYSIDPIPAPAGGCLLTDRTVAGRLFDLRRHGCALGMTEALLASRGRHFRLSPTARLVVGRNQAENTRIEAIAAGREAILMAADVPGPTASLSGGGGDRQTLLLASSVVLRYADFPGAEQGRVTVSFPDGRGETLSVRPVPPGETERLRVKESR